MEDNEHYRFVLGGSHRPPLCHKITKEPRREESIADTRCAVLCECEREEHLEICDKEVKNCLLGQMDGWMDGRQKRRTDGWVAHFSQNVMTIPVFFSLLEFSFFFSLFHQSGICSLEFSVYIRYSYFSNELGF